MKYDYMKLLKTAKYYYIENLTQQEIAEKINVSRPTVSKLLTEAKEAGIVQINIVDVKNQKYIWEMEEKLMKIFGLKDIKIFEYNQYKHNKINELELKKRLGQTAARYFENKILKSNLEIGVAWGYTLKYMIDNLKPNNSIKNLEVVSILGGSGNLKSDVNSNSLCKKIIDKYNGNGYFLYAPVIANSENAREIINLNYDIKEILKKGKNVDVALVGIGKPIGTSLLLETGYFKESEKEKLVKENAIGDICAHFYNEKGTLCDTEINKKIIGLGLKDLMNIDTVIGIAGGNEKIESILAALKGRYINILITDSNTAEKMIKKYERETKTSLKV